MEHFEKQLKRGQKVHMSPDEKSVIRYSISKFIDAHPIPGAVVESPIQEPKVLRVSPFVYHSPFTYMRLLKGVTIVLIALLVGGSTLTYASGNALPGDALYPIKVNVKEAIEEKLATTTEAKAQYQVKRIQKRFEEIKTLESKGDLTPEKEAIVEEVFNSHTEALNQTLTTLESEGKQDAVLETTSQLLPVLDDYSNAIPTETEKPVDTNTPPTPTPESTDIDTNIEDSPVAPSNISALKTAPTESADTTATVDQENTDKISDKTDDSQGHKLATTFIEKIKKEKAHLEERAEKSANDISSQEKDTGDQSIDDVIKSIDTMLNSINVELDRDVTDGASNVKTDDEATLDTEADTESTDDNKTLDSTKVQIDSKTNVLVPTL